MSEVRVAVVGVGGIAQRIHLPTLVTMPGVRLSAIVDIDRARLDQIGDRYGVARRPTSIAELVAQGGADCAVVTTQPEHHPEVAIALLEAGIDVFCEKPLALTLADCRRMVETAERHGRILMAGFNRRFMPSFQKAKAAFEGRPLDVLAIEKNKSENEHRTLVRDGIHMVDTMRWLCGEPTEVVAWAKWSENQEREETVLAQIRFDSGTFGSLVIHRAGGTWIEKAELYGGGCTAIVDAPERVRIMCDGKEESIGLGPWSTLADRFGFTAELNHFVECVRDQRQPINAGPDALKTHQLVDEIYRRAGLPGM